MAVPCPHDDARLLPRYRQASPLLEHHRMIRAQSAALMAALDADPDATPPLKHELTKPGDAEALRGIPAIGRSVSGAIPGTNPEQATIARISRNEHLRERTAA